MNTSLSLAPQAADSLSLVAVDSVGNPIPDGLAGVTGLTWSDDSAGAVVSLVAAEDGSSAQVTAVAPGEANVNVSGTLSDGSTVVSGTCVVTCFGPVDSLEIVPE